MVPPASHKVSRVSWYSGSCQPLINFAYGIFTLSDQISQNCSAIDSSTLCSPQPRGARTTVWALSISLAATLEIEVSFFSSGYLDVSVPPVPFHTLWIGVWILEVCSSGFPHSDISGSMDICSSPKLFAAYHVFHRLLVPRHPPCALISLTITLLHSVATVGRSELFSVCNLRYLCLLLNDFSFFLRIFRCASDVLKLACSFLYKHLFLDISVCSFQCTIFILVDCF